jgi:hypothetical protein
VSRADAEADLLSQSFLESVLREFGVQWTQITIFTGAALSSLHLTPFIDPAVWIVATATSFLIAYVFRRQVSGNLPRVAAAAGLAAVFLLSAPLGIAAIQHYDVANELQAYRIPWTVYAAFAVVVPLAFVILSYRKQEALFGGTYPSSLHRAISENLLEGAFYRESQVYKLEVAGVTKNTLTLRTKLSYVVVNRTGLPQMYTGGFVSPFNRGRVLEANVDDYEIDVQDPDYLKERGFFVTRRLEAYGRLSYTFVAEEVFPSRYSELFTAYVPATSLEIQLINPFKEVTFTFESLLPQKVDPLRTGEIVSCATPGGVLPYQGFRLHWSRTA